MGLAWAGAVLQIIGFVVVAVDVFMTRGRAEKYEKREQVVEPSTLHVGAHVVGAKTLDQRVTELEVALKAWRRDMDERTRATERARHREFRRLDVFVRDVHIRFWRVRLIAVALFITGVVLSTWGTTS